jgi:hypothetical protein
MEAYQDVGDGRNMEQLPSKAIGSEWSQLKKDAICGVQMARS